MTRLWSGCAWLTLAFCQGLQADDSLDLLLRRPAYESLTISPKGDYFAAQVPLDDRTVLAIVRRADMQITARLDPGQDGFVDSSYWVNDRTVFASTSMRFGATSQPYLLGFFYSLDVDGKNRRRISGGVIDTLVDDPDHVLVADCRRIVGKDCWTRVRRMRADGRGRPEDVVDAPVANAEFMADRSGNVRFAWATDDDDIQKLFTYDAGAWTPVNDEAVTGVESMPIGSDYSGKHGFLLTERKNGPDVVERLDFASRTRKVVAVNDTYDPSSIVWSFDGTEPVGVGYGERAPRVQFFDSKHPHAQLIGEMDAAFPDEVARVTSSSRDGRTAVVTVTSDREPGRFYLLDTPSGDLKLLARSRPWLDGLALGRMEAITLSARDGVPLHGFLTMPANAKGDVPLIVMPHGGPFDVRDVWGYDDEVQILATHGYAVLQVNFRGSGGYGRSFAESGFREWGGKMQDDLTDATRWAAKRRGIDAGRICAWGASYGAYAALMGAVREPELYRCVIGMAGPYDLPTMYKWGDVQRSKWGEGQLKRTLGDDAKMLVDRSPSRHVDKIRAKIMLVQGGRDPRVSREHVRGMRRALDQAGIPYEGYFPPEETHGFFRENSRREYYSRVLSFLQRSLGQAVPRDDQ